VSYQKVKAEIGVRLAKTRGNIEKHGKLNKEKTKIKNVIGE